ncbi:hypothetical protein D3C84_501660 [compost metagenome]
MLLHHGHALVDRFVADQGFVEQLQGQQATHARRIVQLTLGESRAHFLDAFHLQVILFLFHQATGRHQHQTADTLRLVEGQFDRDRAAQGVADQHATLDVEGIEQTAEGGDKKVQGVEGVRLV